jgi:hypothetical protein
VRREAISANSTVETGHLSSHVDLFVRTADLVRSAGMLDAEARSRLAASFLWVARRRLRLGNRRAALAAWGACCRSGLVGPVRASEGFTYLVLQGRRGEMWAKRLLETRWPAALRVAGSSSLHRAEWEGEMPDAEESARIEAATWTVQSAEPKQSDSAG